MDYKKAWKYSNRLTVLAVFTVMLGGYFATRSQALFWGLVGLAAVLAAAGFVAAGDRRADAHAQDVPQMPQGTELTKGTEGYGLF